MKILIVNQPLCNRGDESAHRALVRSLSDSLPTAEITVLWVNGNADSIRQFSLGMPKIHYLNVHSRKWFHQVADAGLKRGRRWLWHCHPTSRKLLRLYREHPWVICAPGGICMGGFQNWDHLLMLEMARYSGCKIAYYGRSIGPFPTQTKDNRLFREISLRLLHYFSFLSLRDKKSEELAGELDLRFVSTVDTAFLDRPHPTLPAELEHFTQENYVVFVPNLLIWHYAYRGKLTLKDVLCFYAGILQEICRQYPGQQVLMLPQTFDYGTYEGDDILFFKDLERHCQNDRLVVLNDTYSSDIQQTLIARASCVIGARYHSVVFALNNAVPFLALSYEHKINGLLSALGKEDLAVDISGDRLFSATGREKVIQEFSESIKNLQPDQEAMHLAGQKAAKCFDQLKTILLSDMTDDRHKY
ncbi:MAG: polysaccharide pyruvyl transferase family protein [Bacteroidales bacterium]|nr:polysaccharide pyruvyl transferase family protein [Bacteroidales bacterium]